MGGLVAAALVVCAAPARAATSHTAYVANLSSGSVTPIDSATNATGPAIAVGGQAEGIAITPDGKTAYVTHWAAPSAPTVKPASPPGWHPPSTGPGSVTPIDTTTNTAGPAIPVGNGAWGIAIAPDGKTAYVSNDSSASVTPIDIATNTAGPAIPVGSEPEGIAITPDGKTAYVINNGADSVTPINTATNTPTPAIPVGTRPIGIAITPDGKTAYVTNEISNSVTPINTATNTAGPAIPVGRWPGGIAITPDGKTAYVANDVSDSVTPIDTATNTAGPAIPVSGAVGIAITPDGHTAYVTNNLSSVTPIDTATKAAGTAIPVSGPFAIAITPDQAPVAAFSATAAGAGQASSFDASGSSDRDGTVASYRWDFGDGSSLTTASPTITHTYATPSTYTVTLTVTDATGCSTAVLFTGQTVSCNGSPAARVTQSVKVTPATNSVATGQPPAPTATPAPTTTSTPSAPTARCVVPRLRGVTLSRARTALARAGCTLGRVSRPRHVKQHHILRVVAQSPVPGAGRNIGVRVDVTLR